MAAGDPTVGIEFDANAADLAAQVDAALQKILAKTGRDISKVLGQIGRDAGKNLNNAAAQKGLNSTTRAADELRKSLKAIGDTTQALQGQFGKSFDPKNVAALDDQLRRLAVLQQKLKDGAEALGDVEYDRLSTELKAVSTGVIATRESFLVAARAGDEMRRNVERNARQASRVQVQESKAATGRYVVDAQTAAAAARDASRQQIEATKASSRQRVAIIQATARTIATIERGLRVVFQGTATAIAAAFRGVGTAVSGVASGISSAFRRSSADVTNNVSNSYSKTFKNATSTVQNETNKQTSIIKNFSSQASSSLSSIGAGAGLGFGAAVGGLLGLGAARAISGGFQRATILENSERALTKLLGTAEEAKTLLTEVTDVVTGTPFRLDQFAAATTQLLAFNVEADKIPEVLRTISDAAALSIDPDLTVDRLVRTFGQIQSAGKLATEDINQLTEAGVPAWALLGNQLGKTTLEMRDLVTEGAIPATQAIDLLLNGIQNGTEGVNGTTVAFAGLSKELGSTLKGSVANFFTSISRLGANIILAFKEPFTAVLGAATAAVDLLSSALKTLAVEVSQSAAFQAIQRGLVGLTKGLKEAKTALQPFFEFISGGLVLLGQFAGALFLLKRVPGALTAIGSAFKFLLAPQRLLIAGGVLLASYFKKLYDDSVTLREGMAEVGRVLGRIATVIKDLVVDSFEAVASAFKGAGEATGEAGSQIKGVLRPALERLASFLEGTVLPAVRNFARTMREDVLPFIGTALAKAVTFAKNAFSTLVEFIRSEVIPVVGPILSKAVDVARTAFERFYNFLADKLVPFIQSNLLPVLAGVGTALGVLALSGGNLPLAGLAGLTAGAVAVLSNEDIRNALVDSIQEGVKQAQEALRNLFDGVTIGSIIKGALKVANQIGKVLGDIASDRRLLAALGGIAATAAALAVAFIAGFVEGIINNIPELIAGLSNALEVAFEAAVKSFVDAPLLTKALVAAFAGVGVLAAVAAAGRKVGQTFQKAATFGPSIGSPVNAGASGFVSALFGGPGAIEKQVATQVAKTEAQLRREFQRLQRVALQASGDIVRGANGTLLKTTDARALTTGMQEIENRIGKTNLAAAQLRAGIGQVGDAFRKGQPFLTNFSDGLRSIGEGVKGVAPVLGQAAGIAAGGAFAATFVSQALFDINSSGKDKLQAGLGLAAASIGTGAAIGGGVGAAAGAGVAAVGILSSAFGASKQRADELKASVEALGAALQGLAPEEAGEVIDDTVLQAFNDASTEVKETLIDLGIAYSDFADAAAAGEGVQFIAAQFAQLGPAGRDFADALLDGEITLGRIDDAISGNQQFGPDLFNFVDLRNEIEASGVSVDDFERTFGLLGETAKIVAGGLEDADLRTRLLGVSSDRTGRGMDFLREKIALAEGAADVAATATQAYKDKITELNDARIDQLKDNVDDARDALGRAKDAAEEALQAVKDFFSGGATAEGFQESLDEATVSVVGIGQELGNLDAGAPDFAAKWRLAIGEVKTEAVDVLAKGISDGTILTKEDAAAKLQPLIDAAGGLETPIGQALNEVIAGFSLPEGTNLLEGAIDAQALITEAQTTLSTAELNLEVGATLDPELFVLITTEAETAFKAAGQASSDGYVEGLDDQAMKTAASEAAAEALAAAEEALGIDSPSKKFAAMGAFSAQGFVQGFNAGALQMSNATRTAGLQAMAGLVIGLRSGSSGVYATIRSIGQRMVAELRRELQIESPSKVTEEIGEQTVEGFIKGVDDSLPLIDRIAFSAGTFISKEFTEVGERAGQAIGIGFAEQGAGFASSVAGAMDDAFDLALSKVDQFQKIGQAIGKALFAQQGTSPLGVIGGGPGAVNLERAFLEILGNTDELIAKFRARANEVIGKDRFGKDIIRGGFAFTFDRQFDTGRANRADFLEAGQAIREYGATLLEGGRSAESAVGEMRVYRDQIISVARGMNASQAELDEMITTLGLSDAQLNQFIASVNATQAAAAAAAAEAERAIANQVAAEQAAEARRKAEEAAEKAARDAEKAWQEASDAAEKAAREAADRAREEEERRRREYTLQQPVFRDLIIQSPSGDPEAVALAAANRVAFSIRR